MQAVPNIIGIIAGIATIFGTVFTIVVYVLKGKHNWGEAIKIFGTTAVIVGTIATIVIVLVIRTPTDKGITSTATDTPTSTTNFTPPPKGQVTPQEVQTCLNQ